MKNNRSGKSVSALTRCLWLSLLSACSGGGGSGDGVAANSYGFSGHTVDDYVLGAEVSVYNAQGTRVFSTVTSDAGYFAVHGLPDGNYRLVVTGGVQDIDGLSATTHDQSPNTMRLTAYALSGDKGKVLVISPFSTGLEQGASSAAVYEERRLSVMNSMPSALVLDGAAAPSNNADALRTVVHAVRSAGGANVIVSELSDDGKLNESSGRDVTASLVTSNALLQNSGTIPVKDPSLVQCISDALETDVVTPEHLRTLTELSCRGYGISSLSGLSAATALSVLDLADNWLAEADLSGLPNLKQVSLRHNSLKVFPRLPAKGVELADLTGNCIAAAYWTTNAQAAGAFIGADDQHEICSFYRPKVFAARFVARNNTSYAAYNVVMPRGQTCEVSFHDDAGGDSRKAILCDGSVRLASAPGRWPKATLWIDGKSVKTVGLTDPAARADGSYVFNQATGALTMTWVSSSLPDGCGPRLGTEHDTAVVGATSLEISGANDRFGRDAGIAGNIRGTWTALDNGNTFWLKFSDDGKISVSANIANPAACTPSDPPTPPDTQGPWPFQLTGGSAGVVKFVDTAGATAPIPADAMVRIVPLRFQNNASGWDGPLCKLSGSGAFGSSCLIRGDPAAMGIAFADPNEKFQVVVFRNHVEPTKPDWNCREDVYRYVGDRMSNGQWSTITVRPLDYQDRSGEICQ